METATHTNHITTPPRPRPVLSSLTPTHNATADPQHRPHIKQTCIQSKQPHGPGAVLASLVGAPPLASPLILTVLNLLCPETQARPRPPAPEVVAAAKSLRELRCVMGGGLWLPRSGLCLSRTQTPHSKRRGGNDVAYLLPVLGGLTREEMERDVLPPLMEQDRVDERLLKRMISCVR